jgi:RNA polymerase sigma-70 factor (ECF subfamily)
MISDQQPDSSGSSIAPPREYFATTRWTVVLTAGRRTAPEADVALQDLCRTYWYPLYAFVRRQGHSKEDSEDLVQGFFARFLDKNYLEGLSRDKGKFRAFLLASLKHFLANEWDRATRQKRGGNAPHLSLDWQDADSRYQLDPADHLTPDKLYDRAWAVTLLERVLLRLKEECVGKSAEFDTLKPFLSAAADTIPYEAVAAGLGISAGTARVAVHRLRRRYRDLLRDEIAQTLTEPGQLDEELRALLSAFAETS